MSPGDAEHRGFYSLVELMAGNWDPAEAGGWMTVLVPDPGTDVTDIASIYELMIEGGMPADEWDFGVVTTYMPPPPYGDVKYEIKGMELEFAGGMKENVASKHMTVAHPWGNETFTPSKVEPLVALDWKAQAGEGEIAYRLVNSYFSIEGDEPTLTLEGTPISMQLAMIQDKYASSSWVDLLQWVSDPGTATPAPEPKDDGRETAGGEDELPQEVVRCFRTDKPWSECYNMMASEDGTSPVYVGEGFKGFYSDVFKPDEITVRSPWVPSPAELLTTPGK